MAEIKEIIDFHIETLKIIDAEMQRLHVLIQRGDGDSDDHSQQLGDLQNELIRLSTILSEKEVQ